jgi:hypothetical protein
VRPVGLSELKKKIIHLLGSRTRDLLACSIMPQTTTLLRVLYRCEIASLCEPETVEGERAIDMRPSRSDNG